MYYDILKWRIFGTCTYQYSRTPNIRINWNLSSVTSTDNWCFTVYVFFLNYTSYNIVIQIAMDSETYFFDIVVFKIP